MLAASAPPKKNYPTESARLDSSPKGKSLTGRWERTLPNGGVWVWHIQANNTFTVASKGKIFVSGDYRIRNGIYDVNNASCNNAYHGQYRFAFFAQDSVRFTAIADTCRERRGGTTGPGWKRLANKL